MLLLLSLSSLLRLLLLPWLLLPPEAVDVRGQHESLQEETNAEEQEGDAVDVDDAVDVNKSAATVVANRTVVEHVLRLHL